MKSDEVSEDIGMAAEIQQMMDEWQITKLLTRWVLTRDAIDFEKHRELWTADGTMHVGFFAGGHADFMHTVIDTDADSRHFLGMPYIDINGDRARSEAYALLMARVERWPGPLDLLAHLRFHDMLLKVDGQWRLHKRYVVFEKDRIDFVVPAGWKGVAYRALHTAKLRGYRPQARHLSFVWQHVMKTGSPPGHPVVDKSAEAAAIRDEQAAWLAGVRDSSEFSRTTVVDAVAKSGM